MRGLGMYICIYNVYNAHVFWNHALSMNRLFKKVCGPSSAVIGRSTDRNVLYSSEVYALLQTQ